MARPNARSEGLARQFQRRWSARKAAARPGSSISEKSATVPSAERMRLSNHKRFWRRFCSRSVNHDLVEERVDWTAQSCQGRHGFGEILAAESCGDPALCPLQSRVEVPLGGLDQEIWIGCLGVAPLVLLFLDPDDIGGPTIAGEKVHAVATLEERLERPDAGDEPDEIVVVSDCEGGSNEIVADVLATQVNLQAVREEGPQGIHHTRRSTFVSQCDANTGMPPVRAVLWT